MNKINFDDIMNTYIGFRKTRTDNGLIYSNDKCDFYEIYDLDENEYRFIIDNFPFPRRFYNTNIPWLSIEDFENDLKRMKIEIPKKHNNL
jgi:hypothetical protein